MDQNAESLYSCGFSAFVFINAIRKGKEGIGYAADKRRSNGVDSGWAIK